MNPVPLRTLRFVVLALAGGTLMISGVFVFLRASGATPQAEVGPLLAYLVPLVGLANTSVYLVLRRALVARARAQPAAHRETLRAGGLPREFAQLTLVGCALAEALGLLGAIAYFLGATPFLLAAPALALAAILAQFPTVERFEALLRD